jgi:hypothetical protein
MFISFPVIPVILTILRGAYKVTFLERQSVWFRDISDAFFHRNIFAGISFFKAHQDDIYLF